VGGAQAIAVAQPLQAQEEALGTRAALVPRALANRRL
jgi:hypothetical protein